MKNSEADLPKDKNRFDQQREPRMTREELINELKDFLNDFKEVENGGYPEVTISEIDKLHSLFKGILELKYERDADRWLPLVVQLRSRIHHMVDKFQLLKDPEDCDDEELKVLLRNAQNNVDMATQQVEWVTQEIQKRAGLDGNKNPRIKDS